LGAKAAQNGSAHDFMGANRVQNGCTNALEIRSKTSLLAITRKSSFLRLAFRDNLSHSNGIATWDKDHPPFPFGAPCAHLIKLSRGSVRKGPSALPFRIERAKLEGFFARNELDESGKI
jgi:hypothetical protein